MLAQLGSVTEVVEHVPGTLGRLVAGCESTAAVDDALRAEVTRMAHHTLHTAAFSLAAALAYLMLRERDLNRISAILKGKRLKVSPDLIRQAAQLSATTESGAPLGTAA
jgi:V/A-type H+-transporting ATPase subunit C